MFFHVQILNKQMKDSINRSEWGARTLIVRSCRFPSLDGDVQYGHCCDQSELSRLSRGMPRTRLETLVALAVASTLLLLCTLDYTVFQRDTSSMKYLSTKQVSISPSYNPSLDLIL